MAGFYFAKLAKLDGFRRWFSRSRSACGFWLGKHCVLVAWLGLLLAVISPPHGSGIAVCWFQGATGLPCPGCGLTRSFSCGIRGMFLESWHYHPMGLLILALFVFTAAQSLFPHSFRDRLARRMQTRAALFNTLYFIFVAAFITFGIARALAQCWAGQMIHPPPLSSSSS